MAISSLLLAAGTFAYTQHQQKKAEQAQQESRDAQRRQAEAQNIRETRKAREKERRQRAAIVAQGVASGGGLTSSATQGTLGSISTQTAETVGFAQTQVGYGNFISNKESQAAGYLSKAQTAQAFGNLALSASGPLEDLYGKGNKAAQASGA